MRPAFLTLVDRNTIRDRDGNEVRRREGLVQLKLKSEEKPRTVGYLRGGVLEIFRNEEKHYYRLGKGWAFNWILFLCAHDFGFSRIHFHSKFKKVNVFRNVEEMLAHFQNMPTYKKQGFEQQKYLPETFFGVATPPAPAPAPVRMTEKAAKRAAEKKETEKQFAFSF